MAKAGLHLTKACERCGTSYRQSRSDQRYCSQGCGIRAWRQRQPKWQRRARTCSQCGDQFTPSAASQVYCNGECGRLANLARKRSGEGKGWSKGIEYVPRQICESCGGLFYAPPALKHRGGGRFCSTTCRGRDTSLHPEKWPHTKTRRGYGARRTDLENRYFRSSWEANYARYLNWLIAHDQIARWEFEIDMFEFPVKRGSKFYTPDFKVHALDGSFEYHEVKGYMDQRSATKLKRMAKYYPRIRLRVIDKTAYLMIERSIGASLPHWESRRTRRTAA